MIDDAELTPFENWLANLEVDVIEGEYGYERGEFTIYSSHWRELFDQGLTPRDAWVKALGGYANARKAADDAKTANYARIISEDDAAVARAKALNR